MNYVNALIIGAGPVGLSCGIAAEKVGVDYIIIDKGCLVNSIHNFPEEMTFFSSSEKIEIGDVPFTSLALRPSRKEALEYYRRVAQHFKLKLGLFEALESIEKLKDHSHESRFKVVTTKKAYYCDHIINAAGFYDTPVLMNIPGEDLPKVKHYFKSAHHLFSQKVAVVGASNSAVDVALDAYRKGADVTMLVRGESISDSVKYWVKPDIENRIKEGSIKAMFKTEVVSITDEHITVKHEGKIIELENDFVYAMTGYQPNLSLIDMLGMTLDETSGYPAYDKETMESNVPGIYLAGVVCGGFNTRKWFIENSRDHGDKIMQHIIQMYEFKR